MNKSKQRNNWMCEQHWSTQRFPYCFGMPCETWFVKWLFSTWDAVCDTLGTYNAIRSLDSTIRWLCFCFQILVLFLVLFDIFALTIEHHALL